MTSSPLPPWASHDISRELPILRSRGEGQDLEYKSEFPSQTTDLAREIAAFATTNDGHILIGVDDSGNLVGLDNASTQEERDEILRRIEGICRGTVKPPITPKIAFAVEADKVVLSIQVPKGPEPVYYSTGRPYIRNITESVLADPSEVASRVLAWNTERQAGSLAQTGEDARSKEISEFLYGLASILRNIRLFGAEVEIRQINPGRDNLKFNFGVAAEYLRDISTKQIAIDLELDNELRQLAAQCQLVADYLHTMGRESWDGFVACVQSSVDIADGIWEQRIASVPLAEESRIAAIERLSELTRQAGVLSERAEQMINSGHSFDLQTEISQLGEEILNLAYLGLDREEDDVVSKAKVVGQELHQANDLRLTMGGAQYEAMIIMVQNAESELGELVSKLSESEI